jgi:hypothetical protein
MNIGPWQPGPAKYSFIGSSALDQASTANYALLQSNDPAGETYHNSPTNIYFIIANNDRLVVDTNGVTLNGAVKAGSSELYFTKTDHVHTGIIGDAPGCAAIQNTGAPYNALMITGRSAPSASGLNRLVKLWDRLEVIGSFESTGDISIHRKHAFRGSDGWLRLNQDAAFPYGTHTPGLFAPMRINVGGARGWEFNPGNGSIIYAGQLNKLDVGPEFTAVVRCADFTIGGIPGRRASPGRAIVDSTDTLVINYAGDWTYTQIDGQTRITKLISSSSAELKQDIEPMSGEEAARIVGALDPVSFRWRDDPSDRQLGFIAENSPRPVTTPEWDGIFMSHIVAALTRVVQDQAETIASLEQRMTLAGIIAE